MAGDPNVYTYMEGVSRRGSIWDNVWNEAKQAGVDPRQMIARKKGELGKGLGRDYWDQFQQQRFMALTQGFDDLAVAHDMARAPVTSGRRRGVGTSGVGGGYARGLTTGGPSSIFAQHSQDSTDLFGGYRSSYFQGARSNQGLVDFESLNKGGRTHLRNVAFAQFFDPRLSGQQEEAAGGAMKTAIARGIRGKAVGGLAGSMGQRFMAGNRRAALDFITKDILKSQREYAASTQDPGQAIFRDEKDIHNFLARASAFHMLSQGRFAFQGQAQQERSGLGTQQGIANAILQGERIPGAQMSSLGSQLNAGSQYVKNLMRTSAGGSIHQKDSEIGQQLGAMGLMTGGPLQMAAGLSLKDQLMRYGKQAGGQSEETQNRLAGLGHKSGTYYARNVIDTVAEALQRDLFSPGSTARASDIALGALDRDISARGGRADYSIDTVGGNADYRRLFESAFSIPGGTPGQYSPLMRNLSMAPGVGGGGLPGLGRGMLRGGGSSSWLTPELSALQTGTGSERALEDKLNYIRQQMARNSQIGEGFINETALYNSYNQQMNALRQGSDYLAELRSNFLSPMSF